MNYTSVLMRTVQRCSMLQILILSQSYINANVFVKLAIVLIFRKDNDGHFFINLIIIQVY